MTCKLHAFSDDKCPACFHRDPTVADIERMLAEHSVPPRIGTYYTPNGAAESLDRKVVDPACGTGAYLAKALKPGAKR